MLEEVRNLLIDDSDESFLISIKQMKTIYNNAIKQNEVEQLQPEASKFVQAFIDCPPQFSKEKWDKIKYVVFLFYQTIYPDYNLISNFNSETDYGPLFSIYKRYGIQPFDINSFNDIFASFCSFIKFPFDDVPFHSVTNANYLIHLPDFMKMIDRTEYQKRINYQVNNELSKIDYTKWPENACNLALDMIYAMKMDRITQMQRALEVYEIVPHHLFNNGKFFLFNSSQILKEKKNYGILEKLLGIIKRYLESGPSFPYSERLFRCVWEFFSTCLVEPVHKRQFLPLLLIIIKNQGNQQPMISYKEAFKKETTIGIQEIVGQTMVFNTYAFNLFLMACHWPSCLGHLFCQVINYEQIGYVDRGYIRFYEQIHETYPKTYLDKILKTDFKSDPMNLTDYLQKYNKNVTIEEKMHTDEKFILYYLFAAYQNIIDSTQDRGKKFTYFMNRFFDCAFRNFFLLCDVQAINKHMTTTKAKAKRYLSSPKRNIDGTDYEQFFVQVFQKVPEEHFIILSLIITNALIDLISQNKHTFVLILRIHRFLPDKLLALVSERLINHIFEIAPKALSSDSYKKSNYFLQTVAFTIRFVEGPQQKKNKDFGRLLIRSEELLVRSLRPKEQVNQEVILKALEIFNNAKVFHNDLKDYELQPVHKFSMFFEDFRPSAREEAADIYSRTPNEKKGQVVMGFIEFVETGLKSKNPQTVAQSMHYLEKKLDDPSNSSDSTSIYMNILLKHYLDALKNSTEEEIKISSEVMCNYAEDFIKPHIPMYCASESEFLPLGIRISDLMQAVVAGYGSERSYAPHIISLAHACMEKVKPFYEIDPSNQKEALYSIMSAVCDLYRFKESRPHIKAFFKSQLDFFVKQFLCGGHNVYFLVMNRICSSKYSKIEEFVFQMMDDFMLEVSKYNPSNEIIDDLMEQMPSFYSLRCSHTAMINGYTAVCRHLEVFSSRKGIYHIKNLILNLVPASAESSSTKMFGDILKMALPRIPSIDIDLFLMFAYQNGGTIIYPMQWELIKRMKSLNIPISINSYDEIPQSTKSTDQLLFRFSAAFVCGINSTQAYSLISDKTVETLKQLISTCFKRLHPCIVYFLYSLFKSNNPVCDRIIQRLNKKNVIQSLIIGQTKPQHLKLRRKTIKAYFDRFPIERDSLHMYMTPLMSIAGSPINELSMSVNYLNIMTAMNTVPDYMPTDIFKKIVERIDEFIKKPPTEQVPATIVIIAFISALNSPEFITRNDFANMINERPIYLSQFMKYYSFIEYYSTLPINIRCRSAVLLIAQTFPKLTVMTIKSNDDRSVGLPNLMEWLITKDKSCNILQEFCNELISIAENKIKWTMAEIEYNQQYFEILAKTSNYHHVASKPAFEESIVYMFKDFLVMFNNGGNVYNDEFGPFLHFVSTALINVIFATHNIDDVILLAELAKFAAFDAVMVYFRTNITLNHKFFKVVLDRCILEWDNLKETRFFDNLFAFIKGCTAITTEDAIWYTESAVKALKVVTHEDNKVRQACILISQIYHKLPEKRPPAEFYEVLPSLFDTAHHENEVKINNIYSTLLEEGMIPDEVFIHITAKMISSGFVIGKSKASLILTIRSRQNLLSPLPPIIGEAIRHMVLDRLSSRQVFNQNVALSIYHFIAAIPEMMDALPFDPFVQFARNLKSSHMREPSMKSATPGSEWGQFTNILACFPSGATKKDFERFKDFFDLYFQAFFLKSHRLIENPPDDKIKLDKIFLTMLELKPTGVPRELYRQALQKHRTLENPKRRIFYCIVIYLTQIIPVEEAVTGNDVFSSIIRLAEDPTKFKSFPQFTSFLSYMCREKFDHGKTISSVFMKYTDPKNMEIKLELAHVLLTEHVHDIIFITNSIMEIFKRSDNSSRQIIFIRLCEFIARTSPDDQMYLVHRLSEIPNEKVLAELYITATETVVSSDKVVPAVKAFMLEENIYFSLTYNIPTNPFYASAAKDLSEGLYCKMLILNSITTSPVSRIKCIDTARSIIGGENPTERFHVLRSMLPLIMWQDRALPVLTCIMADEFAGRAPLCALANIIDPVGDKLLKSIMEELVQCDPIAASDFLREIISGIPRTIPHSRIVSAVSNAFTKTKQSINILSAIKVSNITNDFSFLEDYLESDEPIAKKHILPHSMNDFVFAAKFDILRNENSKFPTAAAHLFLGDYSESSLMFGSCDEGPAKPFADVAFQMSPVPGESWLDYANRVLEAPCTLTEILKDLSNCISPEHVQKVNKKYEAYQTGVFKTKRSISMYDIDRNAFMHNIISASGEDYRLDFDKLQKQMNPAFIEILKMFKKVPKVLVTGIEDRNDVVSVVPTFTVDKFQTVKGYTEFGEIIVDSATIKTVSNTLSHTSTTLLDYRAWSSINWSIYMAEKGYVYLINALQSYTNFLGCDIIEDDLLKFEISSRIASLLWIAIKSEHAMTPTNSSNLRSVIDQLSKREAKSILAIWAPLLMRIRMKELIDSKHLLFMMAEVAENPGIFQNPNAVQNIGGVLPLLYEFNGLSQYIFNETVKMQTFLFDIDEYHDGSNALKIGLAHSRGYLKIEELNKFRDPQNKTDIAVALREFEKRNGEANQFLEMVGSSEGAEYVVQEHYPNIRLETERLRTAIEGINAMLPKVLPATLHNSENALMAKLTGAIHSVDPDNFLLDVCSHSPLLDPPGTVSSSTSLLHRDTSAFASHIASVVHSVVNMSLKQSRESISRGLHIDTGISFEVGSGADQSKRYSLQLFGSGFMPLYRALGCETESDLFNATEETKERARLSIAENADTPRDLFLRRAALARSYAASCIPQILLPPSGARPPLLASLKTAEISYVRAALSLRGESVNIRMPSVLCEALGPHSRHVVAVSIAAAARAVGRQLEPVRAVIEAAAALDTDSRSASSLQNAQSRAISRLSDVVPGPSEDCSPTWLDQIESLLE